MHSLATGYKDIFKDKSTGFYKSECKFEDLVSLYNFDEELRSLFLRFILNIERAMKSQYSYVFCERFGEQQDEYLNVNNYNYKYYQTEINELVGILRSICTNKNSGYDYIRHNICKHNNVPLWVLVNALTLGNISKMYDFSLQSLQSAIAKEYKDIYPHKLSSMLSVLSKFRNVCAHNERLYNYRTQKSITDLHIHNELNIKKNGQEFAYGKCDLFAIVICFKYLLNIEMFNKFLKILEDIIKNYIDSVDDNYGKEILEVMGFPENWKDIKK